jgi:TRAP-type uncharacterized transport system substrate-binding protein
MHKSVPRWARVSLFFGVAVLAGGIGLFTYRYLTRPVTLAVAVGSVDGEGGRIMSAIANRLASNKSSIRLKVVDAQSAVGAAEAISSGKADLAIARSDIGNLSQARTVVLMAYGVVMIIAPPGSPVKELADLKNRTLGVIGGHDNDHVVDLLKKEYELTATKMQTKYLAEAEVRDAIQLKQVHALIAAVPISDRDIATFRSFVPSSGKRHPRLIAIESAEAIVTSATAYESYELPKGALRGAPAIPDKDLTTLRVPVHLVAKKELDNEMIQTLTKAVMESRRDLVSEYPLANQISAPNTEKDANIPIHPGAKQFFDGEEKTVFERYGDQLLYGMLVIGSLTSALAAAWKFIVGSSKPGGGQLIDRLNEMATRVRSARSEGELEVVEDEIDAILKAELEGLEPREAINMAAARLERLIHLRSSSLRNGPRLRQVASN